MYTILRKSANILWNDGHFAEWSQPQKSRHFSSEGLHLLFYSNRKHFMGYLLIVVHVASVRKKDQFTDSFIIDGVMIKFESLHFCKNGR